MLRVGNGAEWLSCTLPIIGPGKELRHFRLCTNWHMEASLFSQSHQPVRCIITRPDSYFFIPRVLAGSTSPHPANNPHRDHPSSFLNIARLSPIPRQREAEAEMIDFDRRNRLNSQLSQKPLGTEPGNPVTLYLLASIHSKEAIIWDDLLFLGNVSRIHAIEAL